MTKIIAEAGVNHNGDAKLAFELVKSAYDAGADIVKFQTFKAGNLVTLDAEQAEYQIENTGRKETQFKMLKNLELSYELHFELMDYCDELGIGFLSTAFDKESLSFLTEELRLKTLKIPSGEITNAPLVLQYARTGCDLIISTGMATLAEIEDMLGVVAFGYTAPLDERPSREGFERAYFSEEGQIFLKQRLTLLHCTTEYPAPLIDVNLRAMDTIREAFNLKVGYSDHTKGVVAPLAAVARGAILIEKHFTLDKNMQGPDHKASMNPEELTDLVNSIREVELLLGDGLKGPRPSEVKNRLVARKSLVARTKIKKNELFDEANLTAKRPGTGISPYRYWDFLGQPSPGNYSQDQEIEDK